MSFDESKVKRDGKGKFAVKDTPAEEKRAGEILGEEDLPEDITELLGEEFTGVKGQEAIHKLIAEQRGHVKGAFHREDIGDIDLIWGDESCGLRHILMRREEQGIDTTDFISDIAHVIENGSYLRKNERGRFEFQEGRKVVVISPELRGNKITFMLTAYKTRAKK